MKLTLFLLILFQVAISGCSEIDPPSSAEQSLDDPHAVKSCQSVTRYLTIDGWSADRPHSIARWEVEVNTFGYGASALHIPIQDSPPTGWTSLNFTIWAGSDYGTQALSQDYGRVRSSELGTLFFPRSFDAGDRFAAVGTIPGHSNATFSGQDTVVMEFLAAPGAADFWLASANTDSVDANSSFTALRFRYCS